LTRRKALLTRQPVAALHRERSNEGDEHARPPLQREEGRKDEGTMLTRFDPFAPFRSFDDRFQHELTRTMESQRTFAPAVDIFEEKDGFVVKAELAGVKPEEIHVDVENGVLTLKGERKLERDENKDGYHRVERWYGSFQRQFTLPRTVDAERIEAATKDGVLTVRIPKKGEAKGQKISVKTA
jgi:HSP20 family protein